MDKHKLDEIRNAERNSHTEIYSSATLFEDGTWLKKPVKTVMNLLPIFKEYKKLRCLDLGSGIGRNSIPIAQEYCSIDCMIECVDILELAIEKLDEYAVKYNVTKNIKGFVMPLELYPIRVNYYDLIIVISALEHIQSKNAFMSKLNEVRQGICRNGIICLVINSDITEICKETNDVIEPQFEVNLSTDELKDILNKTFEEWDFIKFNIVKQQYEIPREEKIIKLSTNVVTLVAQKK